MTKRRAKLLFTACVAGSLAFCLPVGASLIMARSQGQDEANEFLEQLTVNILRRSAALRRQSNIVIDQLVAEGSAADCTADSLDRMRQAAAASGYLQGIGRIRDNVLECSTLTDTESIDLGPPDRTYVSPGFPMGWDKVELPPIPQTNFAVTAHAGYAAIYLPELISDIALPPGVVVGQFASSDRKIMRIKGIVEEKWLRHFKDEYTAFEDEQGHLVVITPSDLGNTAAVAAMPASLAKTYVRKAGHRSLPVGLAIGALLALGVFLRARYLLSIQARLRDAIRRKEFHLVYQPVIDLRTNLCVGAEALIRWNPPDEKAVSPAVFIPVAESHGLIQQITAQVMEIVARDAVELIKTHPDIHIAINFSPEDLHSPQTEARLRELVSQAGAQPSNIMIEATERGLMKPEKAKGNLVSIRAQGFTVAIDDFGTGSSSLSYLATYDLDVLKIDKIFVDSFELDSPTTKIALHIIEIARTLQLEMIAEGVETERQRDVLREAGVQYAQGWLFAKPMLMSDLVGFMSARNSAGQAA